MRRLSPRGGALYAVPTSLCDAQLEFEQNRPENQVWVDGEMLRLSEGERIKLMHGQACGSPLFAGNVVIDVGANLGRSACVPLVNRAPCSTSFGRKTFF